MSTEVTSSFKKYNNAINKFEGEFVDKEAGEEDVFCSCQENSLHSVRDPG